MTELIEFLIMVLQLSGIAMGICIFLWIYTIICIITIHFTIDFIGRCTSALLNFAFPKKNCDLNIKLPPPIPLPNNNKKL